MVRMRRLTRFEDFKLEEYERILMQLPSLILTKSVLGAYVRKLLTHGIVYVLDDSGRLCGFLGAYANDTASRCGYLSSVVVDSTLQGGGWGTKLFQTAVEEAKAAGMEMFEFTVLKTNVRAITFYRRLLGAVIVGTVPGDDSRWILKGLIR